MTEFFFARQAPCESRCRCPALVLALALLAVFLLGGPGFAGPGTGARVDTPLLSARLDSLLLAEDYVEAFALGNRLLAARSEALGPVAPPTLAALQKLGAIAHLSGDQDLAEELTRIALQRRRETLDPVNPDVAESLYWQGQTAQYHADRAQARACLDEAMSILVKAGRGTGPLAGAITQAAASLQRNASLPAAIEKYREALAIRTATAPRPSLDLADNETWLGWCLYRAGRFDEAMAHFQAAERELRALHAPGHSLMGTIWNFQGNACAMRGDWSGAERFYRSTSEIFGRCRDRYLTGYARRKIPIDGLDFLALAQLKQGLAREAWESLGAAHGHLTAEFVAMARWHKNNPVEYRQVFALRARYFEERRRYMESWSRTDEPLPGEAWASLLRSLDLYAQINRLESRYLSVQRGQQPNLAELRRGLDGRSALVGWLQVNTGADERRSEGDLRAWSWGYVVRADGPVRWFPLWEARGADQLRNILAPSRRYIQRRDRAANWATTAALDPELAEDARTISRRWFEPLLPGLQGVDQLVVDASSLPFAIPIDAFPLADGRYVCDAFTLSYLPSLTALARAGGWSEEPPEPYRSVLTVSTSAPRTAPSRGRGANNRATPPGDPRRVMAALPEADREVGRISRLFPAATQLRGVDASESRLLELVRDGSLGGFDVIHVATHALFDDYPERCALALERVDSTRAGRPDGYVDAKEILGLWQLHARIVALSGCESSTWSGFGRGEFLGLVPALFGAGARSVVGGQWPVQDRATALVMTRFYENMVGAYTDVRRGASGRALEPNAALQEAKIWLRDYRDSSGVRPFEHPVYWSGYVLVGFP